MHTPDDGHAAQGPDGANTQARGAYAAGRARKAVIVQTATELFGSTGFHSVSMLDVAAACGISRAGLLHHFPSKELLLTAVLAERDAADETVFRWSHSDDADGRPWLARLVDLVAFNATRPELIRLFAVLSAEATAPQHPAHDYFVERYQGTRRGGRDAFGRAQLAGVLAADADPELLAIELIALMDGLQVQWLLDPERVDMAATIRRWLASVLTAPLPASTTTSPPSPSEQTTP
ncbi:TetR/AcrR family transcriptional regulator [Microterricola viridarii]|uniref:TetR/AcrR family transcriptional regulator n=1 Tax=Microterricola viridarii TaxID=412690 RepID=UPI0009E6C809|nr:TetR/AcrR family transcriptional regulator [Microterricola viridarii]